MVVGILNLFRDFTRPCDQRTFWLYRRKILIVCNHSAMFGDRSNCDNGDIPYLTCHMTLQDYMIKGSCEFIKGNFFLHVTTILGLVLAGIAVVEMFLIITWPHLNSRVQGVLWLYWWKLLIVSHYPVNFSAYGPNFSHDLVRPHDQKALWPYGRKLLIISPPCQVW